MPADEIKGYVGAWDLALVCLIEPPHPRGFKHTNNKSIVNVRIGMVTAIIPSLLLFVYSNEAPRR